MQQYGFQNYCFTVFWKITKDWNIKTCNILGIVLVSQVFKKIYVHFWTFLNPGAVFGRNSFFIKISFLSEILKKLALVLMDSSNFMVVVHRFTLTFITQKVKFIFIFLVLMMVSLASERYVAVYFPFSR